MKTEQLQNLLEKYYNAETDLQEEKQLKKEAGKPGRYTEENDLFAYFGQEAFVPENLESDIFGQIMKKMAKPKTIRMRYIPATVAAAAVWVFFSVFLLKPRDISTRQLTDEEQFVVLEQALSQVSYSLQPEEDDGLLVVFQDENFEIVMN